MTTLETWLVVAQGVAEEAGEATMGFFRQEFLVQLKGDDPRDWVTAADLAAEALIRQRLGEALPGHTVISEESSDPATPLDPAVPTWVVDPVDGTSNFAHGLPFFAISLGLHWQGQGQVAVIHAPALGWTFVATRGGGAWWNERPVRVSTRPTLQAALVACDWPRHPVQRREALALHAAFAEQVLAMRSTGSAALGLALVAAGWLDVYFNARLYPWDTVAGALLLAEAGGQMTELDGSPWTPASQRVLATNGLLHDAALRVAKGTGGETGIINS